MYYRVVYTHSVAKDIRKLDKITQKKLKTKIETYSANPLHYAKKLIDSRLGTYRWRAGNYRIVFDIDKSKIVILRIGHRREIYK